MRSREHLLVSNTGPRNEGYTYCTSCGRIEPTANSSSNLFQPHPKPYPEEDNKQICEGISPTRHIILGTDFITDIALFSLHVPPPLCLKPGLTSTTIALRTVSEALASAACRLLEVESGEIMAEFRPALTPNGKTGREAEIFLYDTLSGGAGFSSQLPDQGLELFQLALHLMESCPEGCDASCYRCLRSFKNKFEHTFLDRHVGIELLKYLLTGVLPKFNKPRLRSSTKLLYNDLQRQSPPDVVFHLDVPVLIDNETYIVPILGETPLGEKHAISLTSPLVPDSPACSNLEALLNSSQGISLILENELVVRDNLPAATLSILEKMKL